MGTMLDAFEGLSLMVIPCTRPFLTETAGGSPVHERTQYPFVDPGRVSSLLVG